MRKFFETTISIIYDIIYSVVYFIGNNLRNLANILSVALPYGMLFLGQYAYRSRQYIGAGSELLIPVIVGFVIYFIRSYANKINKGTSIPLPHERFTDVGDDGEVSVAVTRTQEMILYVADLEDWLERKGLL